MQEIQSDTMRLLVNKAEAESTQGQGFRAITLQGPSYKNQRVITTERICRKHENKLWCFYILCKISHLALIL